MREVEHVQVCLTAFQLGVLTGMISKELSNQDKDDKWKVLEEIQEILMEQSKNFYPEE